MNKSVLAYVQKCKVCNTSFIPEVGEICECPEPMYEDHPFQPQRTDTFPAEEDKATDA